MTEANSAGDGRAKPDEKPQVGGRRADAKRNLETLLQAAKAVFAETGVDAPVREIAERAGVGVGTFYRHFPQRSDLIEAVFRQEVDACAAAASTIAAEHEPEQALMIWMERYLDFIATKRGLAKSLHTGNTAFASLPAYFETRLKPACEALLKAAIKAGKVRNDVDAWDLLRAIALLSTPDHDGRPDHSNQMVSLLLDGLKRGATNPD